MKSRLPYGTEKKKKKKKKGKRITLPQDSPCWQLHVES